MRVFVTGLGIITSIGMNKESMRKALFSGTDGVSAVGRFDVSKIKVKNGYEIQYDLPEITGTSSRVVQLGYLAAKEALGDSGMAMPGDCCLVFGSGLGDEGTLIKLKDKEKVKECLPTRIGAQLCWLLGLSGGIIHLGSACAAGLNSIAYGYDMIKQGEYDVVLTGGMDSFAVNSFAYFSRVTTGTPVKVTPFDKNRVGMLMGEGAGFLVLESEESTKKRKVSCYAEILGYARSSDAFHMSNMSTEGITKVIAGSIKAASLIPADISYLAAHGTGTRINDQVETQAIKAVYGSAVDSLKISSIKSMIGHTGGASGVIGCISGIFALQQQCIPPTINLKTPDPECDLFYTPNEPVPAQVDFVQVNAFGFGGVNCSLILGNYTG